jgi:nitrate/nitrite transporter NarK
VLYYIYIGITLSIVLLLSMNFAYHLKDRMAGMSAMIISMFIGMNIGLTSGILLGTINQGDLFLSTLLAMLIGTASGTALGIIFSPVSSIEGFMSGLMGGMMGAMLGEMVPPEKSLILINIFLTISLCTLFLFKIFPQTRTTVKSLKDFIKPALAFLLVSAYLLLGTKLGAAWIQELHGDSSQLQHQHQESPGH